HAAVAKLDRGLFPGAFCRIGPDVFANDPAYCAALHADGAGTKALVAYLRFRETGDPAVFRSLAQDSLVMNLDDLACIGAVDRFMLCNTIDRNPFLIPGDAVRHIVEGYRDCIEFLRPLGVDVVPTGGETADLGDAVRTLLVNSTLAVRLPRSRVVDNRRIQPGDVIVGLSSTGRATYESTVNSGVGSNGLTLARHALLSNHYRATDPETVAPQIEPTATYRGPHRLGDPLPGFDGTVGDALASPTRTYAPVVRRFLEKLGPERIHGMVHATGGGATKCLHFGDGIAYVKDDLFPAPPLFRRIAETGGVPWREMYQSFNMGCRFEVYLAPNDAAVVLDAAAAFSIDAKRIGRCEPSTAGRNTVRLETEFGVFDY
ncbi:MAG: AIR synthase-related protein, partial [Planctomycetia bacterium]